MEPLTIKEIMDAVSGKIASFSPGVVTSIETDSRKVSKGALFVALKGEKEDGHNFVESAIKNNAAAILSEKDYPFENVIVVKDTLLALGELAKYYRGKFNIPVVAVTGSVGKTSTKEMISSVLSTELCTHKTSANHNNELGLPLTILELSKEHEALVLEMGMRGFGEIEYLSKIASPDIGVITNIGIAHIERLGSRENIKKAKSEISLGMEKGSFLVLNGDEELLSHPEEFSGFKVLYYGIKNKRVSLFGYNIEEKEGKVTFDVAYRGKKYGSFILNTPGEHNVMNALAAIAVGRIMDFSLENIKKGVENYQNIGMRQNIFQKNGITIIEDFYNAGPESMRAGISVLSKIPDTKRKIAVLSDMLELGDFGREAHEKIGEYLASKKIDFLLCKGELSRYIISGAKKSGMSEENAIFFENDDDLISYMKKFLEPCDAVLLKGSRGMHMEKISGAVWGK